MGWGGGEGGGSKVRNCLTHFNGFKWSKVQKLDCRLLAGPVHQEEVIICRLGFGKFIKVAAHTCPRRANEVVGTFHLVVLVPASPKGDKKKVGLHTVIAQAQCHVFIIGMITHCCTKKRKRWRAYPAGEM